MSDAEVPAASVLGSQAEYARHRKVTPQRISDLKKEGRLVMVGDRVDFLASDAALPNLPSEGEDTTPAPTTLPVVEGTEVSRAQLRKLQAEASLAELKLAKAAGSLLDLEETVAAILTLYGELQEKLTGIGVRHAGELMAQKTEREFSTLLTLKIEEELAAFAKRLRDKFTPNGLAADPDPSDASQTPVSASREDRSAGDGARPDAETAPEPEPVG